MGRHAGRATPEQQLRAWEHLRHLRADILLVQEVIHDAVPDWASEHWTLLHGRDPAGWGSMIAATPRLGLRIVTPTDPWLIMFGEYVAHGEITLNGARVRLASIHAVAREAKPFLRDVLKQPEGISVEDLTRIARPGIRAWVLDVVCEALRRSIEGPFILGGDLNESRGFDPKWKCAGSAFFRRAAEQGWNECCCSGGEVRSYVRKGTAALQLDHVFCDSITAGLVLHTAVLSGEAYESVSDHLPVVVEVGAD
jgi:hypothetical protein